MQISGQAHQEKRIKLSKIRNERREITTNTAEIQKRRIAWTIICQKIGQARKKNRFLEMYSPPKLSEEEIDNLNRTITRREIESVVIKKKNFLHTKVQNWMTSLENFTKHTKKNLYQSFSNSSKRLKRKEHSHSHSMKPPSSWYQNQRHYQKENYRPIL